ncbi:MAG: caspase family protein, partial [Caldilineaceae bacterium]|nr:caspase family protein [Caldilineaceae bacterium]
MNSTPTFYALLIGIDRYDPRSRVPHLRGCTTDAEQMERLLRERFGVPAANILRLTNEEATHQRIKAAFREHLIENARRSASAKLDREAESTPAFLFQYSGHGSQAIDETGNEPDGLDETLVPYDSRTPGVFDIKDWEVGALIEELNQFSENVTVILDCCHSGSGTRDVQAALTRRCAPDLRPQPVDSRRPSHRAVTRAVGAGNWEIGGQHVLLAGCRDTEESHEYALFAGGRRYWQGAMSYFLQQELRQVPPTRVTTYRELFARVRHAVNKTYNNQMPQCEGDIDRAIFGGLRP